MSDYIIRPGADPQLHIQETQIPTCLRYAVPVKITEALIKILINHFSDPDKIEIPQIVNKLYNKNNRDASTLWIGSVGEWNPRITGNRPAILVERLDQKYLSDLRTFDDAINHEYPRKHFIKLFDGQHVIHVLGGRELEAEYIACETFMEISQFSSVIRAALDLILFLPMGITRRRQMSKEYKEHYSIQIPISYRYQEVWRVYRADGTQIPWEDTVFTV